MITHASCFSFLGPPSQPSDLKQHPNHVHHLFLYCFLGCFAGTQVPRGFLVHLSFATTLNSSLKDLNSFIELETLRLEMLLNKIVCKTCQLRKFNMLDFGMLNNELTFISIGARNLTSVFDCVLSASHQPGHAIYRMLVDCIYEDYSQIKLVRMPVINYFLQS